MLCNEIRNHSSRLINKREYRDNVSGVAWCQGGLVKFVRIEDAIVVSMSRAWKMACIVYLVRDSEAHSHFDLGFMVEGCQSAPVTSLFLSDQREPVWRVVSGLKLKIPVLCCLEG